MKNLLLLACCWFQSATQAQTATAFIMPYPLDITMGKTTNLIFPFAVQTVDRGSSAVLIQKAVGTENILHVKAADKDLAETNLTVITRDGRLYSFLVHYSNEPQHLNILFQKEEPAEAVFSEEKNKADELLVNAKAILVRPRTIHSSKDRHDEMQFKLLGIYIANDVFYFQLSLQNESNISYTAGGLRFLIRDRQKSKRTATQETELTPVYHYGNWEKVQGMEHSGFVMALPKFTLPNHKYLLIHLIEKDGGRDLQLQLNERQILRAKLINEF